MDSWSTPALARRETGRALHPEPAYAATDSLRITLHGRGRHGSMPETLPSNHSPLFAPVIEPALPVGTAALVNAARAWLGPNRPA